jgi:hypothetical protein
MDERQRRTAIVAGAAALALLSVLAGALIAASDDDERATPIPTSSPIATTEPSPSASPSPSTSPSASASPAPAEIEDGRHFVFVTDADRPEDGAATVTFDLAYFLTGAEGEQAAAEHGDEFVNGYYIVNDNPRLRTVPLADHVRVRYIPTGMCCELQPGNLDAWLESILETNPTDYDGKDVPWWITVRAGTITRIQQQYLP